MTSQLRILQCLPLFHITGWYTICSALNGHGAVYISGTFDTPTMLKCISESRITDVMMTPKIMLDICHAIENGSIPASHVASLRYITGVGAPVQASLVARLNKTAGPLIRVVSGYGSTETAAIAMFPRHKQPSTDPFPLGLTIPNVPLKLLDINTGAEITAYDTPGELYVSTACMFMGYLNNETATREALIPDENTGTIWYRTGDLCSIRAATKEWVMVGRAAEVFKTAAGVQVSPSEIERVLMKHPLVSDAAVGLFRGEDGQGLNEVKVWVRRRERRSVHGDAKGGASGDDLEAQGVLEYLKGKIERNKMPTVVSFVSEIPRNAAGKVMRRELQKLK